MRVTVDRDLCEANGVCAGLVPDVFRLDDDDELHITDGEVPPELLLDMPERHIRCSHARRRRYGSSEPALTRPRPPRRSRVGLRPPGGSRAMGSGG